MKKIKGRNLTQSRLQNRVQVDGNEMKKFKRNWSGISRDEQGESRARFQVNACEVMSQGKTNLEPTLIFKVWQPKESGLSIWHDHNIL